jgi:sugar transferase (PEP-CTERM/EpsH1 system associated)
LHAVSNGVALDYFQPRTVSGAVPASANCVFVGALDYRPNIDGAIWFCRQVWPLVRRRLPQATISLVGRNPVPAVCRLAEITGVELVGQVPDVRPFLERASVVVVPLQIARGVQNKVLEAMAMEKAVVVSLASLEGLAAEPDVHLLTAATAPEWVAAIERLLADAELRARLGRAARRYVEDHHRWDRCLAPLGKILGLTHDSLLDGTPLDGPTSDRSGAEIATELVGNPASH